MRLTGLLPFVRGLTQYQRLVESLDNSLDRHEDMPGHGATSYLLVGLHADLGQSMLVLTYRPERAKRVWEDLQAWCPESSPVLLFPEPDTLLYEDLPPDPVTLQQRLSTLMGLALPNRDSSTVPPLIVAPAQAVMSKVPSYADLSRSTQIIKSGQNIDLTGLVHRWVSLGYEPSNLVERPGTFARRGGILDIFPSHSELPARLEFSGDDVESIRFFDPDTQRSVEEIPQVVIGPTLASPALSKKGSLLDYLPRKTLLVLEEPTRIKATVEDLDTQAQEARKERAEKGAPVRDEASYFSWSELESMLEEIRPHLVLEHGGTGIEEEYEGCSLPFHPPRFYGGRLRSVIADLQSSLDQGDTVVVVSHQSKRLAELLDEQDIFVQPQGDILKHPPEGTLTLVDGSLGEGWVLRNGGKALTLLTDQEVFGLTTQRRVVTRRRPHRGDISLKDLSPGDFVVHVDHGIGRFQGLVRLSVDGVEREYLLLGYAEGDKLYVPTDQIDRVSEYVGGGEHAPTLTRLSTQEWTRIKEKVRKSVTEIARELLALYAYREVSPGFACPPDTLWQRELEASFPYMETPDQLEAIRKTKEDMESPKSMDRLVCGDVGYGKTEVAVRAAFKMVMNGKQVALLVPTTVLAQQHFATFNERLGAFPVRVEVLSRFRTEKEQRDVLQGLQDGTIDICIGTHRLLQKDVVLKDLGLLIIDEEQRFGVRHKEYLKHLRKEMDVLTLTATPIPRTLHMSLVGVRDMSIMDTPPEDRLPIKTFVYPYDDALVREAILREINRGGQVYFVHNRVQSIDSIAQRLMSLVPEAEMAVAHGQMAEDRLEKVMLDFFQGKIDVLVCTTIIEAGLDVPAANTIIVNQADRFGLAQLYQLRGRVGRGANRAYAYLLFDQKRPLSAVAGERLRTIFEATELGSGFRIAMKDLEIRGAGNLLGPEQSGYISAVGFDLYCRLLAQAVEDFKAAIKAGQEAVILPRRNLISPDIPTIDVPLPAFIPEEFVADAATRMALYQCLSRLTALDEIEEILSELRDRFGEPPTAVHNLLYIVALRILSSKGRIANIASEDGDVVIRLADGLRVDKTLLPPSATRGIRVGSSRIRLNLSSLGDGWSHTLRSVVEAMAGGDDHKSGWSS